MKNEYLMIENVGVAPVESFTLLGASTARGNDDLIGQFGSGSKLSICMMLRMGIDFYVFCGKTRLQFVLEEKVIDCGRQKTTVQKVICQFGGTSKKRIDLGWSADFGASDWTKIDMALREFISNAIDRTQIEQDAGEDAHAKVTPTDKVRARAGHTRIFVELTEAVRKYYGDLPKYFLHFAHDDYREAGTLLPKAEEGTGARIYRSGVLVQEMPASFGKSAFDYSLKGSQVKIDEARNMDVYSLRGALARVISTLPVEDLARVMKVVANDHECFEAKLDEFWMGYDTAESGNWKAAGEIAFGEHHVITDGTVHKFDMATRKGFKAVVMPESWSTAGKKQGATHIDHKLDSHESNGRTILPSTDAVNDVLRDVWNMLEGKLKTDGKECPTARCFTEIAMDGGVSCFGYYEDGCIYIRSDIATGYSEMLYKVVLEEVGHHVTGAVDGSRDIQNFFIELVAVLV